MKIQFLIYGKPDEKLIRCPPGVLIEDEPFAIHYEDIDSLDLGEEFAFDDQYSVV